MIARAEHGFSACVPDGECEISAQVLHARFAPCGIRVKDQLGVGRSLPNLAPRLDEFGLEFRAAVYPCIGGNPKLTIETRGLVLGERFVGRAKQRVAKADGSIRPDLARIRTPIGKKTSERVQQWTIHRSPVAPENSH